MTGGLVQEFDYTVLPNISPRLTFIITLVFIMVRFSIHFYNSFESFMSFSFLLFSLYGKIETKLHLMRNKIDKKFGVDFHINQFLLLE